MSTQTDPKLGDVIKTIPSTVGGPVSPGNDSTGGFYNNNMGSIVFAGTAAMIASILELMELYSRIAAEYNEILMTGIKSSFAGAQASASAAEQSLIDQSTQSKNAAMGYVSTAVGAGVGGLASFGSLAVGRGEMAKADGEIGQSNMLKTNINEISSGATGEGENVEIGDAGATTDLRAKIQARTEALKSGRFDSPALKGATPDDIKTALRAIHTKDGQDGLDQVYEHADKQLARANAAKQTVTDQRQYWAGMGNTLSSLSSGIGNSCTQAANSESQKDQANQEATKTMQQAVQQAGQTSESSSMQARDDRFQQIAQLVQMLQSAQSANQFRG